MTIQTYCENASSAIIYLSLTGGREGKIISNNPPIKVYENVDFISFSLKLYLLDYEGSRIEESFIYQSAYPGMQDGYEIYYFPEIKFDSGKYYVDIVKEGFKNFEYTRLGIVTSVSFPYDFVTDTGFDSDYDSGIGILIEDELGTLYYRKNVEGLNINYSVQCQNCAQGECAGGDGQGGVICMDCESMQNDVNAAIRSYKR